MSAATEEPTQSLLLRLRAGDTQARERLVARYLPRLTRWAHGRLPRGARELSDTQDLVQITLMRVLSKLDDFEVREGGSLLGYLQRALLNVMRNEIRYTRRRGGEHQPLPDDLVGDEEDSPLVQAVGQQRLERYESALARLPRRQQEILMLRLEMHLEYADIAAEVGSTPDAVRMALRRALTRLVEELCVDGE